MAALDPRETLLWATAAVRERAEQRFAFTPWEGTSALPEGARNLVVIGGGSLIDRAKALVHDTATHLTLIAIPSIWGSGAEASPVVVLGGPAGKDIRIGDGYLPAARAVWPELAVSISEARARFGCGDVWAHALEGFLSPLASDALRTEIAALMREMLEVGVRKDARWFELSAGAAAAQARSSVGLVHGIAHTLEPALQDAAWGHARLCSTFLLPVFAFNRRVEKTEALLHRHGVVPGAVERALAALFDASDYAAVLPTLRDRWRDVLRDRSTRTNSTFVRSGDLAYFLEWS